MKKVMIMAFALSLSAASVSCKKETDKDGNAIVKVEDNDARAIIDFNNQFLDSYKSTTSRVENIIKYTEAAAAKAHGETVHIMPIILSSMDYSLGKIKSIPSGFEKEKKGIEEDFNTYKAKKENIEKKFEELQSYITSEDYKDDNGAKADAIKKEIDADAKALFTVGENLVTKIKPATDAAEEIVLKDHPMKEFIISSKAITNSLDSVMKVLNKQYAGGFNEAEIQKKYDELEKMVNENIQKEFNVKGQQYAYKKTQFETINKRAKDFLDKFRKLIRDSKSSGKIEDNNIREIDRAYESVLSSYNSFVK